MRQKNVFQQGFTLLELIIAISIFGMISVMAYGALHHISNTAAHLEKRSEELASLQRAFLVMNRDFQQLADRSIRDPMGDTIGALIVHGDGGLEFTRTGWRNPQDKARSSLQRVRYVLNDGELKRIYWPVLDQAQDSHRIIRESVIITGVDEFEFEFLEPNDNEWQESWPPYNLDPNQPVASLPKMIKISLTIKNIGEVWRFYSVAYGG